MPRTRSIQVRRDDSDKDISVYTATSVEPGYSAEVGRDVHRVVGKIGMTNPQEVPAEPGSGELLRHIPAQVTHMMLDENEMGYGSNNLEDFVDDSMDDAQKRFGSHPVPHASMETSNPFKVNKQFVVDDKSLDKFGTDVTWRRPVLQARQFDFIHGSPFSRETPSMQLKFPGM